MVLLVSGLTFGCTPPNAPTVSCSEWDTIGFFKAATAADVTRCLEAGANVETRDEGGFTVLHAAAAFNGSPAVTKALLDAGADIDSQAKNGLAPLHMAVSSGSLAVTRVLLSAGADTEPQNEHKWTPLHSAAEFSNSPAMVKVLVDAGANIEALASVDAQNGNSIHALTPLHLAAASGSSAVAQTLIDVGADIEAQTEARKWTPLHAAAGLSGSPSAVKALLDAGANIDARGNVGQTSLHVAAMASDSPAVIEALVDAGADIEALDAGGETPLHYAAESSDSPAVVKALVDSGANTKARGYIRGFTSQDFLETNEALKGTDVYWLIRD